VFFFFLCWFLFFGGVFVLFLFFCLFFLSARNGDCATNAVVTSEGGKRESIDDSSSSGQGGKGRKFTARSSQPVLSLTGESKGGKKNVLLNRCPRPKRKHDIFWGWEGGCSMWLRKKTSSTPSKAVTLPTFS